MKKNIVILLLTLCSIVMSCDQQPCLDERLAKVNLTSPKAFKLKNFEADWAIGESTEQYWLLISRQDYQRIIKEIEEKPFFQYIDTNNYPRSPRSDNTNPAKINEVAYWHRNEYSYEIYRPDNGGIVISVSLEKDSLMRVYYEDL